MNILLIGNGFDLAHGLPTKYKDFLTFVRMIKKIINRIVIENKIPKNDKEFKKWTDDIKDLGNVNEKLLFATDFSQSISKSESEIRLGIRDYIIDFFNTGNMAVRKNLIYCIHKNFWVEYFLQCPMYQKENWIDFESEISVVIQSIDTDIKNNDLRLDDGASVVSNIYLKKFFHKQLPSAVLNYGQKIQVITYKEIRDILYQDLNRLIRAFEIYLCEYVEKIEIEKYTDEIKNCGIDHVISFNYSHTYQKLYGKLRNTEYDYIHGEVRNDSTVETNNMVLGIDEYLHKDDKDQEIDFIAFKKYYQRIYKETGSEYKNWVDEIKCSRYANEVSLREQFPKQIPYEKFNSKHKLYIFGHSLDITDRDVLRDLILNDNVYTKIYYLNKSVMGQQIANLVKVIGQDELIRRTGGSTKTIELKLQQDMVDRK